MVLQAGGGLFGRSFVGKEMRSAAPGSARSSSAKGGRDAPDVLRHLERADDTAWEDARELLVEDDLALVRGVLQAARARRG